MCLMSSPAFLLAAPIAVIWLAKKLVALSIRLWYMTVCRYLGMSSSTMTSADGSNR